MKMLIMMMMMMMMMMMIMATRTTMLTIRIQHISYKIGSVELHSLELSGDGVGKNVFRAS